MMASNLIIDSKNWIYFFYPVDIKINIKKWCNLQNVSHFKFKFGQNNIPGILPEPKEVLSCGKPVTTRRRNNF
jgi:hypothetical protein